MSTFPGRARLLTLSAALLLAGLGLASPLSEKAAVVAEAFLAGQPVTLVGLDVDPQTAAFVARATAAGVDPDAAAWMALRAAEAGGAEASASSLHELADKISPLAEIQETLVGATLHPMSLQASVTTGSFS